MDSNLDDGIRTGWEVFARDGSRAGTIVSAEGDALHVALGDGDATVTVPRNLVMEAHGGRVELDMAPEDLGIARSSGEPAAPTRDPGAPPKIATPEQMRRLTGG